MRNDADRFRKHAAFCLKAASIATAPALAAEFEKLAKRWLKMADELERNELPAAYRSRSAQDEREEKL
jgi:hypothetical protein